MVTGDLGQRNEQVPRLSGAVQPAAFGVSMFVHVYVHMCGCVSMCTYMILCVYAPMCITCECECVLVPVCEYVWVCASVSSLAILA